MSIPPPPDLPLLHERTYDVTVYRRGPDSVLARGRVHDVKPPGLYVEDDPEPLTIHEMVVDLTVAFPSLEITGAEVVFETHPQETCPAIASHYENLVGLSIARGFTHRVRELFGGPRGCTHVTALLQAIAPAVVQSIWSMRALDRREAPASPGEPAADTEAQREGHPSLNTCHVWAEDGDLVNRIRQGEQVSPGIPVRQRLEARGKDWRSWGRSSG